MQTRSHLVWQRIHRTSATLLGTFVAFHIGNHLFALHSVELHKTVMNGLRTVYRFPLVEMVILCAAAIQIVSGLTLAWRIRREKNTVEKLKIASGLYLSFFLAYHINAVLTGRFVWNEETDFRFAASVVKHLPEMLFFVPYYFLSVAAVFVHLACIHYLKMTSLREITTARGWRFFRQQSVMIAVAGCAIGGIIVALLMLK